MDGFTLNIWMQKAWVIYILFGFAFPLYIEDYIILISKIIFVLPFEDI